MAISLWCGHFFKVVWELKLSVLSGEKFDYAVNKHNEILMKFFISKTVISAFYLSFCFLLMIIKGAFINDVACGGGFLVKVIFEIWERRHGKVEFNNNLWTIPHWIHGNFYCLFLQISWLFQIVFNYENSKLKQTFFYILQGSRLESERAYMEWKIKVRLLRFRWFIKNL